MLLLSAIFLLFLSFTNVSSNPETAECTPGQVWADGKIKMECTSDGVKPIACLPSGAIGGVELAPTQDYSSGSFKYQCSENREQMSMSLDVIACLLPNGTEFAIGTQIGVSNKGTYKCVRNSDATVVRKLQQGCFFNDRLYAANQFWISENGEIKCVVSGGFFEATASGCVIDGQVIKIGAYAENNGAYFKCVSNELVSWKADFIKVSEAEYRQSIDGGGVDEEEAAGGDSNHGFTRPITTTVSVPQVSPKQCNQDEYDFQRLCQTKFNGLSDGVRCYFTSTAVGGNWTYAWDMCKQDGGTLAQILTNNTYSIAVTLALNSKAKHLWLAARRTSDVDGNKIDDAHCPMMAEATYWYDDPNFHEPNMQLSNSIIRSIPCSTDTSYQPRKCAIMRTFWPPNVALHYADCIIINNDFPALCQTSTVGQDYVLVKDLCLAETVIATTLANTYNDCVSECNKRKWCRSFNFVNNNACQLFSWSQQDNPKTINANKTCAYYTYTKLS